MLSRFLVLTAVLFCAGVLHAQDKAGGPSTITAKDFALPASALTDNKNAVILSDVGSIGFTPNKNGRWVSYVFKKKTRIKIVNQNASKLATVHIYLYGRGERQDVLENVSASTYNMENGQPVETKFAAQDIFEDKLGTSVVEKKFTLPAVKDGSIIEYSYTVVSYRYASLPSWYFQHGEYPCLYSSMEIGVPDLLRYVVLHKGIDSFSTAVIPDSREHLVVDNVTVTTDVHHHKWEMKNVPGFEESNYMHAYNDYFDQVEFYLAQTYNGSDISGITTWTAAGKNLASSAEFGQAVTVDKAANLFNTMEKVCPPGDDLRDAVKHIYAYVRDNFTCIENDDIYLWHDLYDVNKSHKGSVAEINLLLTALLRQKGLKADPVILSTTDYGIHPVNYPVLDKMNYVICMLKLFGDTLFLDASRSRLGFNKLPLECYNGHAKIISDNDTGAVFLWPASLRELKRTTVIIQNDDKTPGLMAGNLQMIPGYHESYKVRENIGNHGLENYFKNIKTRLGTGITLENEAVDSLKQLEDPVTIHYDFSFNVAGGTDLVYYTPVLDEEYKTNPFSAAERKYPVEMASPINSMYVFKMEIPKGYVVDELPKSAKVSFNGNEGFYEYIIQKDEENIQLRTRIKLDRTFYRADEYNTLRDFFAFVVKKQAEQIVFKKKP